MRDEDQHFSLKAVRPWRPKSRVLAGLLATALGLFAAGVLIGAYAAGAHHF